MKFIKIIGLGFIMGFILLNGLIDPASEAQQPKVPPISPFSQTSRNCDSIRVIKGYFRWTGIRVFGCTKYIKEIP